MTRPMTRFLTRAAFIGTIAAAWATAAMPAWAAEEAFDTTAATVKMMAALALIIGLLLIAMWLLKKFSPAKMALGRANRAAEVLGRTMLTPKAGLTVVKVGGKVLVLGVTDHHVGLVAEVTDRDEIEALTPQNEANKATFADLISKFSSRREGGK